MTKKILSIALVVVMLFSFTVTSFAAVSQSTVQSTVTTAAKLSFTANGAGTDNVSTTEITLCYFDGEVWNVTARCAGGYYYKCTVSETLGLISNIDSDQENEFIAFFNEIIESILDFLYGIF